MDIEKCCAEFIGDGTRRLSVRCHRIHRSIHCPLSQDLIMMISRTLRMYRSSYCIGYQSTDIYAWLSLSLSLSLSLDR